MNQFLFLIRTNTNRIYIGTLKAQDGAAARKQIESHQWYLGMTFDSIEIIGVTSKTFQVEEIMNFLPR